MERDPPDKLISPQAIPQAQSTSPGLAAASIPQAQAQAQAQATQNNLHLSSKPITATTLIGAIASLKLFATQMKPHNVPS